MKKNIMAKTIIFATLILIGAVLLSSSGGRVDRIVQASSPPSKAWSQNYGGYYTDEKAYSMVQTSDGGYALAGTIYSYPNPPVGTHGFLAKTDPSGNLQWNRTYGGSGEDQLRAVVQTSDGGYALAGYSNSFSATTGFDFWLVKTDSDGIELWSKTYWSNGTYGAEGIQDYAYSIVQTRDGGYALAGYSASYGAMLVTTDSAGNWLSIELYGSQGDRAYSMVQTLNGGYALAGSDVWILDSAGGVVVEHSIEESEAVYAYSIVQTSDTGYAYAGDKNSLHVGNDIFLIKTGNLLSPSGTMQWNSAFGGDNDDNCNSVIQTSDGGYALAGRTKSYGHGNWDFYLIKTNSEGGLEWQDMYGGAYDDGAYCVIETSDGGLALAGYSKSNTNGGYDMWLVKLSAFLPARYSATIWSWDSVVGWLAEPITMDGVLTGLTTPHNFTRLFSIHNFTVPENNTYGTPFMNWTTGEISNTLTVSTSGIYTAQYYQGITPIDQFRLRVTVQDAGLPSVTFLADYTSGGAHYVNTTQPTPWNVYADAGTTAMLYFPTYVPDDSGQDGVRWRRLYNGDANRTVTMDKDRSVTISYRTQSYVTFAVTPPGAGTIVKPSGNGWFDAYNQIYLLEASANSGYKFVDWTTDNPAIDIFEFPPGSGIKQFTPGGPGMITAEFEPSVADYSATIWSWDSVGGWLAEPITMNGVSTGFTTPHTFADLVGDVTFTVPDADGYGSPFTNWTTGETSTTLTVNSGGTYTAQYYKANYVTIWAWDNVSGWLSESITMDGVPTGFNTPHTFTGLSGNHNFTVPSTDAYGNLFVNWTTGETSPTLTVSSDGTYTAQYYYGVVPEFDSTVFIIAVFMTASALTFIFRRKQKSSKQIKSERTTV